MPPSRPPISLRPPLPDDLRFIRASWFESYRKGGCAPAVGFDLYKAGHGATIERLTTQAFVTVAFAAEVPDEICGWVCATGDVLHYVYVKQAYRRLGIGSRLCQMHGANFHSHETRTGRKFATKLGTRFNPYSLYQLT